MVLGPATAVKHVACFIHSAIFSLLWLQGQPLTNEVQEPEANCSISLPFHALILRYVLPGFSEFPRWQWAPLVPSHSPNTPSWLSPFPSLPLPTPSHKLPGITQLNNPQSSLSLESASWRAQTKTVRFHYKYLFLLFPPHSAYGNSQVGNPIQAAADLCQILNLLCHSGNSYLCFSKKKKLHKNKELVENVMKVIVLYQILVTQTPFLIAIRLHHVKVTIFNYVWFTKRMVHMFQSNRKVMLHHIG